MNIVILYDSLMKNILVFTSTFPKFTPWDATPGFVYELSRRLADQELHTIVLTPRVPGSKTYEEINGLKIYRYPYFFWEKLEKLNDGAILPNLKANKWLYFQIPFLLLSWLYHLIKVVNREKIHTIHAHWIIPQWLLAVLYKKIFNKNITIVCTTHGGDIFGLKWKIWTFLKKYVFQNIDVLTTVSKAINNRCIQLGIPLNKTQIIPMWVDNTLFHPNKYDESIKKYYWIQWKFILFVGRLAEKKWVTYLIDAMPWVIEKHPDTKLIIIWQGPLENELKKQTKKYNLDGSIIFAGAIPNTELPRYYATADIFVGPSIESNDGDSEWFWLVFVESILSWCITLGSNLHGITDIIENWITWYLIQPKDSVNIKNTILTIIEDNTFDIKNARIRIEKQFSWDIISKKYLNLLK